ncbi:MAG: homocysteine S-methyltransferase family protein [Armatimonadetes bacterium]|nr:homocysteine S-methyltransferase family protein [Armatimonadota bacterium]
MMSRGKQMLEEMGQRVLVCEGAMGSMLTVRGIKYRNTAEINLTHPEVVAEIHRSYQQAGAEVFQTNSFAANNAMLRRAGLEEQAASIQTAAVRIAREAVGPQAYLAAGAGPTGELVEPLGELSRDEAVAIYRQQFEVMLATGMVDFVLLETFEDMGELQTAIRAVREVNPNIVIAATMSFSMAEGRTMMGVSGTEAARQLAAEGVDIIGANCGDLEGLIIAAREMCQAVDRPLMVQANAGQPQLVDGEAVFRGTPQESGQLAAQLIACGVRLMGGCCGTTPDHIREIARAARAIA